MIRPQHDPELDLILEREVDVAPELVWKAWTEAEHLKKWFVPRPWTIAECRVDLRPGGEYFTIMRSPDGDEFPNSGCYLVIEPGRRLVFTDALLPGFRPAPEPFFTAEITIEAIEGGTRYRARAMHRDQEGRDRHEAMGFHEGWGTCFDQLVELVKGW